VIPVYVVKRVAGKQCSGNDLELFKIFAAPLRSLDVSLKLLGVDRGKHQRPSFKNIMVWKNAPFHPATRQAKPLFPGAELSAKYRRSS
jgi:hypothetical protein